MMWNDDFREHIINLRSEEEKRELESFLKKQNLSLDKDVEYSVALLDGGKIVGTGSFSGRILKCIAVDDNYKNVGLSAKVVTLLISEAYSRGRTHLFIYTKPENKAVFSALGFYEIAEVSEKVVLMENKSDGIRKYLDEIVRESGTVRDSAAVIVNCNPFTLGHRYLIEYAASRSQILHVFVLWEDKSSFPSEIRYKLVKDGVKDLENVVVHKGKDYIISDATFPSYFIKEFQELVDTQIRLDLEIFTRHIAPALCIKKRFVGEEPYCKVTSAYNLVMQEMLPGRGIDMQIVPRMINDGQPISASRVRELIRENRLHEVKAIVPETTYQFLISKEADDIIRYIQSNVQRH